MFNKLQKEKNKTSDDKEIIDSIISKLNGIKVLLESYPERIIIINDILNKYSYINYSPKAEVIKLDQKSSNILDDLKEKSFKDIKDEDFERFILKLKLNLEDRNRYLQ